MEHTILNRYSIVVVISETVIVIVIVIGIETASTHTASASTAHEKPGYYGGSGFGGGLLGTFSYYPFWFLSIGVDAGFRIIISQGMKSIGSDLELPDYEGGTQTLNFSSMNLKAYISLQI